jgi:hypothetical protein
LIHKAQQPRKRWGRAEYDGDVMICCCLILSNAATPRYTAMVYLPWAERVRPFPSLVGWLEGGAEKKN